MISLRAMLLNESGASAAEYALILAVVGTSIILSAIYLGEVVGASLSEAGSCISSDGSNC